MQRHDRDGTPRATVAWCVVLALTVLISWVGGLAVELSPWLPDDTRAQITATSAADWCAAASYGAERCTDPAK